MIFINFYNTAPDYYLQNVAIKNISHKYNFVKVFPIGKSLCGRKINALSIGNRKNPVLYACTFHGMEWFNTLLILHFFEEICCAYNERKIIYEVDIFEVLNKRGLVVIPCVNPDGVEIQIHGAASCPKYEKLINKITDNTNRWQSNARGVDLNHNFNAGWQQLRKLETEQGITGPAPTRFGGRRPFSEVETMALCNFCLKEKFSFAIAFHSQGREIYSEYKDTPKRSIELGERFSKYSGYKIANPPKIATGGGFKDWLIGYMKTPAITVETGLGENPLPASDYLKEYELIKKALVKCLDF